jgi:hypothetical protein
MFLAAQILLTTVILGYTAVPVLADFNRTHATNPLWIAHARYHVVWQVCSYLGVGAVSMWLLWAPGPERAARSLVVVLLALCIYAGFFAAAASMRLYGGSLADPNGIPPLRFHALGTDRILDLNVLVFTLILVVLAIAGSLLAAAT